jgi:hypothetical protein
MADAWPSGPGLSALAVATTTMHPLYLLYVLTVFILTLKAQVHPALYAAVGSFVVEVGARNRWVGLPYNGVAGHWSVHLGLAHA